MSIIRLEQNTIFNSRDFEAYFQILQQTRKVDKTKKLYDSKI